MEKEKPTQKELRQAFEQLDDKYKRPITLLKQLKFQIFQVSKQN